MDAIFVALISGVVGAALSFMAQRKLAQDNAERQLASDRERRAHELSLDRQRRDSEQNDRRLQQQLETVQDFRSIMAKLAAFGASRMTPPDATRQLIQEARVVLGRIAPLVPESYLSEARSLIESMATYATGYPSDQLAPDDATVAANDAMARFDQATRRLLGIGEALG